MKLLHTHRDFVLKKFSVIIIINNPAQGSKSSMRCSLCMKKQLRITINKDGRHSQTFLTRAYQRAQGGGSGLAAECPKMREILPGHHATRSKHEAGSFASLYKA